MKEILTKIEMQSCQQLLILPYHYSFYPLAFSQISEEYHPEDISKINGIPFVEIVWFKMSATDSLDHTPNQLSYLMIYMSYKYDVNIYIMF